MASTKKGLTARFAAGLAATAVATLTVLGGALPASAAADDVEPGRIGSITVHKFAEPETATGLSHDGTVVDTAGLTPLEGVEFTVAQVNDVDLSTAAGWTAAAALTPATATDVTFVDAIATDEDGVALFADLPIGVYLVSETDPGSNSVAIEAAPFLVSIPIVADDAWLYDVHVYPKNSLMSITKSVDDSTAFGLGDDVSWSVTVDVPEIAADDSLDEFVITDPIDPRLSLGSATLALTVPGLTPDAARREISLALGTHYTVTTGATVVVTFTAAGRQLLAAQNGAELTIEAVTTVVSLGDGIIENVATLTVNGTTVTSDAAVTEWGTLAILNHVTGDEERVLSGSEFQVFSSEADATAGTNPIDVSGATTFSSDEDGIAWIPGLRTGTDITYWIVETAAPVGYVIDSTPLEVTVVAGDVDATTVDVRVEHDQVGAYALPITGGTGQAAFMIGGAGLLAAALGFALFRRRKADAEV